MPILKRTVGRFKRDNLTDLAAGLTYYGLLALFPGMLVLVSILGFLGESASRRLLTNIGQIAPGGVHSFLEGVMHQVQGRAGAATIAAAAGIILALWSASGYVAAFMRTANTIFRVGEGRPIWATARVRLLTTVALVVMLVISAAIVVLSGPIATKVGKGLGLGDAALLAWEIAKWPVLVILVSVMVTLLYKATPNETAQVPVDFSRRCHCCHRLGHRVRRLRRVRLVLRFLQQDLRGFRDGDHLLGLAVDQQYRHPLRG